MDLPRIVTVVGLLLPSIYATTVPVDQTLMFKEIDSLLRRCPCVPTNTCYSQGVSLNEQNFLNTNFECEDQLSIHCCGPYYQTVGNEDFYFDENGFDRQGAWRKPPDLMTSNIMIVMPPEPTTESPESLTKVVLVYPETTTKPTTERVHETTTEDITQEPFAEQVETTTLMADEDTTTELVTSSTNASTTEASSTTNRMTLSPQEQRLARLQNRPPYPTKIRSTRSTTTTTTTTSTTTEPSTTTPRFSTIKTVYKPSRHRQAMNKLRLFVRTSTTPSSAEYDDDYDDEEEEEEENGGGARNWDTNNAEEEDGDALF